MEAVILILPLLLLGWLFLTSSRRQKRMKEFASSLDVGDKIVTSSGMFGTIRHLDDVSGWIEVADGVTIRVDRRALSMKQPGDVTPSAISGIVTDTSTDSPEGQSTDFDDHDDDDFAGDTNGEGTSGNRAAGQ